MIIERILDAIEASGGTAHYVGGAVRDAFFGFKPKDIDIEVFGIEADCLATLLRPFGRVDAVGASFGVLKFTGRDEGGERVDADFSLPRSESKAGRGHRGFMVTPDAAMSARDAAARRDFTINALYATRDGHVVDHFGGADDLRARVLRHTSPAFADDPLRVLRGMQFAARFDMTMADETVALCRSLRGEYDTLSKERIWGEWEKWARKGVVPSRGLNVLYRTGWIRLYPEIAAMIGVPQEPDWHPEGWSAVEVSGVPVNSFGAGVAQSAAVNLRGFLGELRSIAPTYDAVIKSGSGASITQAINDSASFCFSSTIGAGTDSFGESSGLTPTRMTEAESLVRFSYRTTPTAREVVWVMFKVPLARVLRVVNATVNDFEVIGQIVCPVAINMMNVLSSQEGPADHQLHDGAVDIHPSTVLGAGNAFVPAHIIVDTRATSVNGDVVFYFDIPVGEDNGRAVSGHADVVHASKNITTSRLFQVAQGSVYIHTQYVCDAAAEIADREGLRNDDRMLLVFAALCHDMGKPETTETVGGRIRSHGHAHAGVVPATTFMRSIGAPEWVVRGVAYLTDRHMAHVTGFAGGLSDTALRRLALSASGAGVTMHLLSCLIEADASGRPPLPKGLPRQAENIRHFSESITPLVQGRHLIERGHTPGPHFGAALKAAFDAQIDGKVHTVDEGVRCAESVLYAQAV